MRRWLAPSAIRTAISLEREVARDRSRFAMFAHAIKSTSPAALKSRSSGSFTFPTITCCSGSIAIRHPFSAGNWLASPALIVSNSARA